jgi:hypothetical protein
MGSGQTPALGAFKIGRPGELGGWAQTQVIIASSESSFCDICNSFIE